MICIRTAPKACSLKSAFLRLLRLHKLLISKLAHRKDSSTQLSSTNWQLLSLSDYKSIFVPLRSTRWIYGRRPAPSNWSNLSQCAAFGTYLFSLIAIYSEGCARENHFSHYLCAKTKMDTNLIVSTKLFIKLFSIRTLFYPVSIKT